MGYIIIAAVLLVDGLLFNAWAISGGQRRSSEVLELFFYCASGTTMLASSCRRSRGLRQAYILL